MKESILLPTEPAKKNSLWQKTPYANLIRYIPSGMYFYRIRVRGKLIRKSLKTDVLQVAKLRLGDKEKEHRQAAQNQIAIQCGRGQMSFGQTLEVYRSRLKTNQTIKSTTREGYEFRVKSLLKTWPGLENTNVRDISKKNCLDWAGSYKSSAITFNNTVLVLRAVLEIAVESGIVYDNVARHIPRRAIKLKDLRLPDNADFARFVQVIESLDDPLSKDKADLVRFLAYGGFRIGEAENITWGDCDFKRGEIVVRGDPDEGTKNGEVRRVPMIGEMRSLLEKLRQERGGEPEAAKVMRVAQCNLTMKRAGKKMGFAHLTHHDMRHLFATRCIESGVDIPTVSRWLGHSDGGALAMKVYGHLRNQHSTDMAKLVSFGSNEAN